MKTVDSGVCGLSRVKGTPAFAFHHHYVIYLPCICLKAETSETDISKLGKIISKLSAWTDITRWT